MESIGEEQAIRGRWLLTGRKAAGEADRETGPRVDSRKKLRGGRTDSARGLGTDKDFDPPDRAMDRGDVTPVLAASRYSQPSARRARRGTSSSSSNSSSYSS